MAAQYHTARFRLVPSLAKALTVPTPDIRKPGSAWIELPRPRGAGAEPVGHVRIGYARASTARQSLDTQTDSLTAAGVSKIFAEKISTRASARPQLDAAVKLARDIRTSGVAVTLVDTSCLIRRRFRGSACASSGDSRITPAPPRSRMSTQSRRGRSSLKTVRACSTSVRSSATNVAGARGLRSSA